MEQRYAELIREQKQVAAENPRRAWVLDSLIEAAVKRRDAARSAFEIHRVLDHASTHRRTAASGRSE